MPGVGVGVGEGGVGDGGGGGGVGAVHQVPYAGVHVCGVQFSVSQVILPWQQAPLKPAGGQTPQAAGQDLTSPCIPNPQNTIDLRPHNCGM